MLGLKHFAFVAQRISTTLSLLPLLFLNHAKLLWFQLPKARQQRRALETGRATRRQRMLDLVLQSTSRMMVRQVTVPRFKIRLKIHLQTREFQNVVYVYENASNFLAENVGKEFAENVGMKVTVAV